MRSANIFVPQDSSIGPLLYLCYVNDFPNEYGQFSTVLYADDTTFTVSDPDYDNLMQTINIDLKIFGEWAAINRLSIHPAKTAAFLYANRPKEIVTPLTIKLDNLRVDYGDCTKFLGVEIDNSVKFSCHCLHVQRKISRTIGLFYKIRTYVTEELLVNLYYSMIYPYLIYCNEVWGGACESHVNSLLLMHKRVIRIITGSSYLAYTKPLFLNTSILKMRELHVCLLAVYSYKENNLNHFIS